MSALAAADLDAAPVDLLERTFDAEDAAFDPVVFVAIFKSPEKCFTIMNLRILVKASTVGRYVFSRMERNPLAQAGHELVSVVHNR